MCGDTANRLFPHTLVTPIKPTPNMDQSPMQEQKPEPVKRPRPTPGGPLQPLEDRGHGKTDGDAAGRAGRRRRGVGSPEFKCRLSKSAPTAGPRDSIFCWTCGALVTADPDTRLWHRLTPTSAPSCSHKP